MIHIRLWHCPAKRMMDLLRVAGAPAHVIDQVQSIVDTCRICRSWQDVAPKAVTSSSLCTYFNEEIQVDLMFWKQHIICHIIDVAVRFAAAGFVPDRLTYSVLHAILVLWFRIYGTPQRLTSDQHWSDRTAGATVERHWISHGSAQKPSGPVRPAKHSSLCLRSLQRMLRIET